VNLPAHLVVVKGTQFFDAKIEGYRDMDLTDVLQMLGRAGRPQFDNSGIARIFTQDSKKAFYKHFLHTGFPVESTLHKVLDNHLGAEVSAGTIGTKQDALDYLTWTFFFRRLHKNPSYYGLEISAEEQNSIAAQTIAQDFMIDLVDKSLNDLAESSCVLVDSATGEVDSTPFGKIMSYYYLSHKTIRYLMSHAKRDPTFQDVLSWMCSATEFDELPVRHNEDLINTEMAQHLPLGIDCMGDVPMWDPHVKAFLLLQAYMSRIDLPITDYVGDQTSVLDQGIRIIQASIDVMAELGYIPACQMLMTLLQSIKSARWPEDHPLSILPGVEVEKPTRGLPSSLLALSSQPVSAVAGLVKKLNLPPAFARAASQLPQLSISVGTVSSKGMTVSLTRQNPATSSEYRIYAPRFPKPQTEGYFLIVCSARPDGSDDELLGLKRVSWPPLSKQRGGNRGRGGAGSSRGGASNTRDKNSNAPLSVRSLVKFPGAALAESSSVTTAGIARVNVKVISDAYPGMEWTLSNVEVEVEGGSMTQSVEPSSSVPLKD
jgi:antiviral helicase SLH1